jgi:sirohydrochlorin cobaltochelatase
LCKYRTQVLGFEAEVGAPQESHHHHVEGIGGGIENCPCQGDCDGSCRDPAFCLRHNLPWTPVEGHGHAHGNSHGGADHALLARQRAPHFHVHADGAAHSHGDGQDGSHHHHPYPHADHPLGPKTLPKIQGRRAREEAEE